MELSINRENHKKFGWLELLIIVLIIAIVGVAALPRIMSSQQNLRMPEMQKQIAAALREARQEAISQKKRITFYYDDINKSIIIIGGDFGDIGDINNKVISLARDGLNPQNISYGEPIAGSPKRLADESAFTPLRDNKIEITFRNDGFVIDEEENVQDQALFFYNPKSPAESAFAVSVLGAGGRVKVWQYDPTAKSYVE